MHGDSRLESTGDIPRVLLTTVFLDVAAVELLFENLLGVLLDFFGCV